MGVMTWPPPALVFLLFRHCSPAKKRARGQRGACRLADFSGDGGTRGSFLLSAEQGDTDRWGKCIKNQSRLKDEASRNAN